MSSLGPICLEGPHLRLEPLRSQHAPSLLAVARAPEIWSWLPATVMTPSAMDEFLSEAQKAEAEGREYAFGVVLRQGNRVVGSTRYLEVTPEHRRVEIGWTWYAPDMWGTVVNPEAKFLLLQHAFEDWHAIRVAFKTDVMNVRSQHALRKLGAQYEGTHRHHRIRPDGTIRDTMWFSILDHAWPQVKSALLERMASESSRSSSGRSRS